MYRLYSFNSCYEKEITIFYLLSQNNHNVKCRTIICKSKDLIEMLNEQN